MPSIDPAALVEAEDVGAGTRVWAFTHVAAGASLGANCNVGSHCYVESGAVVGDDVTIKNGNAVWEGITLEDGVFVGPGVIFTNDRHPRSPRHGVSGARYDDVSSWLSPVRIGRGATLGGGAVIIAGVDVGEFAFVAAAAVVTRNVGPYELVRGNPARRAGWVCRCAQRLVVREGAAVCPACGLAYRVQGDRVHPLAGAVT